MECLIGTAIFVAIIWFFVASHMKVAAKASMRTWRVDENEGWCVASFDTMRLRANWREQLVGEFYLRRTDRDGWLLCETDEQVNGRLASIEAAIARGTPFMHSTLDARENTIAARGRWYPFPNELSGSLEASYQRFLRHG